MKVQHPWANDLQFDLCNSNNCSTLRVFGFASDGGINYFGYVGCNQRSQDCSEMYSSVSIKRSWPDVGVCADCIFGGAGVRPKFDRRRRRHFLLRNLKL